MISCLLLSRTFALLVGAFFLTACSLSSAISSNKWKLGNYFENNHDISELLGEKDGISMLTCGSLCNRKQSCLSFFYNPSLQKCLGSKSFKRGLLVGQATQQEWKYCTNNYSGVLIGLRDTYAIGDWKWWNGQAAPYLPCGPSQPDHVGETCAHINEHQIGILFLLLSSLLLGKIPTRYATRTKKHTSTTSEIQEDKIRY